MNRFAPFRATHATLVIAACLLSTGVRAEDSAPGRALLPQQSGPASPAPEAAKPAAASAAQQPTTSNDFVPAPRRQAGVFATPEEERLDRQRGMADTHIELTNNTNNATATVGNNTASNLTTGNNVIRDGSFSNSSGIPMVIQNTGNNVVIQNATILNLKLQ
jgi:hypothetical protein